MTIVGLILRASNLPCLGLEETHTVSLAGIQIIAVSRSSREDVYRIGYENALLQDTYARLWRSHLLYGAFAGSRRERLKIVHDVRRYNF